MVGPLGSTNLDMHAYHLPLKFHQSLILILAHVSVWNYCKSGEVLTDGAGRGSETFQAKEEIWPGRHSNETYNNLKEPLFDCLGHLYLFF